MLIERRDLDLIGDEEARRIEQDPEILIGKPVLRGTRISVTQVLVLLAAEGTIEQTTKALRHVCPTIEEHDVRAAIRFAAVAVDRRLPDAFGYRVTRTEDVEPVASTSPL